MKRVVLYLFLCLTAMLWPWQQSHAQEYEQFDYRDFKFYKEEEDHSLWGGLNDSLFFKKETPNYLPNTRFALSYASNTYRGERPYRNNNLFGYTTIDYTTLRTMKALGYATSEKIGRASCRERV